MKIGLNNIHTLSSFERNIVIEYHHPHMFEAALKEDERHKRFHALSKEDRSYLVPEGLCFDNKRFITKMDSRTVFHFKIDGEIFSAHFHRLTEDSVIEWKHDPPAEKIKGKTMFRQDGGEDLPSVFFFTEFDDCCFHQEYLIRDYIFCNEEFIDKSLNFIKEKYGIKYIKMSCGGHSSQDSFSLQIQFDSFKISHNLNTNETLKLEVSCDFLVDQLVDSCEFMLQNRDLLRL